MFDEWYAQSSFAETTPSATPRKASPRKQSKPTHIGVRA